MRHERAVCAVAERRAPLLFLGYREVAADILFVRLRGYFGGYQNDAEGIASLCEAIVELDPRITPPTSSAHAR